MRRIAIVAISAAMIAVAGWVYAQAPIVPFQAPTPAPAPGHILTGSDIGIRIDEAGPSRVAGTLMVRLKDGSWAPVQLGRAGLQKLTN